MTNFTTNTYEVKRKIINFSKNISEGLNKNTTKFVIDMEYGLSRSQSVLLSKIGRALEEDIDLKNTIERLSDNLVSLSDKEIKIIEDNYIKEIKGMFPEEPVAIFDDSDIAKPYGRKFEDLDRVIDASSQEKKIVNGYHVCEAAILGKNESQPVSVYSKIYSTKSRGFESMNKYTIESIDKVREILGRRCNMIFDRGYDDNKIIDLVDSNGDYFVIRMEDKRNFLFKNKKKNCHEMAIKRKGKIKMTLWFDNKEEYEVSVSHSKVTLPYNKKDYELVFVYGLDEEHPMILLTNRSIHSKEDVIKVVRLYFSRWRIEEYFRAKKQEYDFENMRVRTLNAMNNLNLFLTVHMGHLAMIAEKMDLNLLAIKIIEASKSLRNKVIVWYSQLARGVSDILKYAHTGVKEYQKIETRESYKQLQLKL